jgi:hypothetical protein
LSDRPVALALDPHFGAARRAKPRNRRRVDGQDDSPLDLGKVCVSANQHRPRVLRLDVRELVALVETFKADEKGTRIGLILAVEQAESIVYCDAAHGRLFHEIVGNVL